MRSRLLASTLGITLLAVLVLGVPLAVVARRAVYTSARDSLRGQATSVAVALEDNIDNGKPIDLARYARRLTGHRLVLLTAAGRRTVSGPALPGAILQMSVPVAGATVTVQSEQAWADERAQDVSLQILGLALLALGAAVALAVTQARRLTAPLAGLAARADALGRGDFAAEPVHVGIAEIDQISDELGRSAGRIATTIDLQRDFASDAAHQLRTPLTGIVLRLDELIRLGGPDLRTEAEAALVQVERLESVITALLARARGDAADPEFIDVGAFLSAELQIWQPTFATCARVITLSVALGLSVRARRAHLENILTCLLENSLQHGAGQVELRAVDRAGRLEITVADAGPGVPDELLGRIFTRRFSAGGGSGIGLALARSLAEAEAGSLTYRGQTSAAFVLSLPIGLGPAYRPDLAPQFRTSRRRKVRVHS